MTGKRIKERSKGKNCSTEWNLLADFLGTARRLPGEKCCIRMYVFKPKSCILFSWLHFGTDCRYLIIQNVNGTQNEGRDYLGELEVEGR
jgi:hypothetical protein